MALPTMTVAELTARSEAPLDGFETPYLEHMIRQATSRVRTRWGALVERRLSAGAITPDDFKDVVARAVLRILRNPEGFTGETEGNYQYQKRATVAAGYLFFSDDDVIDLTGTNTVALPGTYRIGIHSGG